MIHEKSAILISVVTVLCILMISCTKENSVSQQEEEEICESGPYFTKLPVDKESIAFFIVLGQFNPPGDVFPRGQTGLQLKSSTLIPLYAVGDIEITRVESTHWLESPFREGHTDYSLSFEIPNCRAIYGNYQHVAGLEPMLEAYLADAECEIYSTESETVESCGAYVNIEFSSGTVLGQAGGATTGLDFDLFDKRIVHEYVAAHRYSGPSLWAICPQSLFVDPLRDFLLSITGRGELRRVDEPRCGTMEIDIKDTAQGMWVLDGQDVPLNFSTYDKFFALAPDDLQPETFHVLVTAHPEFEVDPGGSVVFRFRLENSGRINRRFSGLPGDGSIYCYVPEGFQNTSFFIAYETEGKVSLERKDHAVGESPCYDAPPDTWAFSGEALRLMR